MRSCRTRESRSIDKVRGSRTGSRRTGPCRRLASTAVVGLVLAWLVALSTPATADDTRRVEPPRGSTNAEIIIGRRLHRGGEMVVQSRGGPLVEPGSTPPARQDPIYYPWPDSMPDDGGSPPELLLRQLRDLHSAGRHDEALLVAQELVRVAPEHPVAHYNHACALSRSRRIDEAFAALDHAVTHGWRNTLHLLLDLDLQPLRHDARFGELAERIRLLGEQERLSPSPLRLDPLPVLIERLDSSVPDILERHRVPGAAVAVIREDAVVWSSGYGVSDRLTETPMTSAARFPVRAPSRMRTIAAVLEEHRAGRLDLAGLIALLDDAAVAAPRPGVMPVSVRVPVGLAPSRSMPSRSMRLNDPASRDPYAFLRLLVEVARERPFARVSASVGNDESAPIAMGHTEFGTRLPASGLADDVHPITVDELARLASSAMEAFGRDLDAASSGILLAELSRLEQRGVVDLGPSLRSTVTPAGHLLLVDEERNGLGCLVRVYPESGLGVAVLYNGAGGADAARRIARLAIGGG